MIVACEEGDEVGILAAPLELACGLVLPNRLVKAAMSDSLGDGRGNPTDSQLGLYQRWLDGGAALAIVGEMQVDPRYPEKPGNLVLGASASKSALRRLASLGDGSRGHVWPQLGHAGALAHEPISRPAGPSALDVEGLTCAELSLVDIEELPATYARAARRALDAGFTGVEVHAGHGFLLSQFLSPLFNHRTDRYGGSIENRCQILVDIVHRIRAETGTGFAIGVKINATDQLDGGLTEKDALAAIGLLGRTSVDVIDISGGTYFPGAASSSDRVSTGPYFADFARKARTVTDSALMLTGGVKTRSEAASLIASGDVDLVGLARAMVLDPELASTWLGPASTDPEFPAFVSPPAGGITAWYTMRMTAIAEGRERSFDPTLADAVAAYESRDADRIDAWKATFGSPTGQSSTATPGNAMTSATTTDHASDSIAWREAGTGEPIVFLHGLGGTRTSWGPQLRGLCDRFRCIAWDMPGYGASAPLEPLTFRGIADRLVELLDLLDIGAATLVGLSFGGMHALHTALEHPDRVARLVLADSSPAFGIDGTTREEWTRDRLDPIDAGGSPADAAEIVVDAITAAPLSGEIRAETIASFGRISARGFRAAVDCLPTNDVRARLGEISQPTLVVVGELDEETPVAYSQLLADGIRNSELRILPGVGHLTPAEDPEQFNSALMSFLTATAKGPTG